MPATLSPRPFAEPTENVKRLFEVIELHDFRDGTVGLKILPMPQCRARLQAYPPRPCHTGRSSRSRSAPSSPPHTPFGTPRHSAGAAVASIGHSIWVDIKNRGCTEKASE